MKTVFTTVQKWFLAQSLLVRGLVVAGCVAVIAGAGVGIGTSVNNSNTVATPVSTTVDTMVASANVEEGASGSDEVKDTAASESKKDTKENEAKDTSNSDSNTLETSNEEVSEEAVEVVVNSKRGGKLENGNFAHGTDYFEVYSFIDDNISYSADIKNGFNITMKNTGTEDWHVQIKQTGIRLENGKTYRLTLDAKSSLARDISVTLQRNGMKDDDWTPYSNTEILSVDNDWKTFSIVFTMDKKTDNDVVFNVSMGKVNGRKITKKHSVGLKNISLEELDDDWTNSFYVEDNLIANPSFDMDGMLWEKSVVAPGAANAYFANGAACFDITNPGTVDWHVQLKQGGIKLAKNEYYKMTCNVYSTVARTIKFGFMDTEYVNWYGGNDIVLVPGNNVVDFTFQNTIADDDNALLMISMGLIEGVVTPAGDIKISGCSLVKTEPTSEAIIAANVEDTSIRDLAWGWFTYDFNGWHLQDARVDSKNGFVMDVNDNGTEDWHIQLQKKNVQLEEGKWYKITFYAKSSLPGRRISVAIQRDGSADDNWMAYSDTSNRCNIIGLDDEFCEYTQVFQMKEKTDDHAIYVVNLGAVDGIREDKNHTISIKGPYLEEVGEPVVELKTFAAGDEILKNPSLNGSDGWEVNICEGGVATTSFNGKAVYDISNVGTVSYSVQLIQKNVQLDNGAKYKLSFTASSNVNRTIEVGVMDDVKYDWFGGLAPELTGDGQERTFETEFVYRDITRTNGGVFFSLGKLDNGTSIPGKITIDNVSLKKIGTVVADNNEKLSSEMLKTDLTDSNWVCFGCDGGDASASYSDGKAIIDIANTGDKSWSVIFRQTGIVFERGSEYVLSAKINVDEARGMSIGIQTSSDQWLGGEEYNLKKGDNEVSTRFTFLPEKETQLGDIVKNGIFQLTFGKKSDDTPATGKVIISEISLKRVGGDTKVEEDKNNEEEKPETKPVDDAEEMLKNTGFDGETDWEAVKAEGGEAEVTFKDGKATYEISNVGTKDYSIQLNQNNVSLVRGASYKLSFKISADVDRFLTAAIQKNGDDYKAYGFEEINVTSDGKEQTVEVKINNCEVSLNDARVSISMGYFDGKACDPGKIVISDISLKRVGSNTNTEEDKNNEEEKPKTKPGEGKTTKGTNFGINLNELVSDIKVGDKIKLEITASSDADSWGGGLGAADSEAEKDDWTQVQYSKDAPVQSIVVTVPEKDGKPNAYAEVQVWWSDDAEVSFKVTASKPGEGKTTKGNHFGINLNDLVSDIKVGDKIKLEITASSDADSWGGCLGANDLYAVSNYWSQVEYSKDSPVQSIEVTVPEADGKPNAYAQVQVWWSDDAEVSFKVTATKVEVSKPEVSEPQASKPGEGKATKGNHFGINLNELVSDIKVGDKIKLEITASSSADSWGGCLGANDLYAESDYWSKVEYSKDAPVQSIVVTVPEADGKPNAYAQVQVWWEDDVEVSFKVTATKVGEAAQNENQESEEAEIAVLSIEAEPEVKEEVVPESTEEEVIEADSEEEESEEEIEDEEETEEAEEETEEAEEEESEEESEVEE